MRALSGIQATGGFHLGNYVGAVKIWVDSQDKYHDNFYFVPDLHSLNTSPDPKEFKQTTYDAVALLLAAGIDPKKSVVYVQSSIPANSELFNILNNYVTVGELERMTQFKDKVKRAQWAALLEYPVLMTADIILYDVDVVPVGADQKQHVELARDIAERFNKRHGDTFKLPKPVISEVGSRIMNLQDPSKKMSKSDNDSLGTVYMADSPEEIKRKISRAITDSDDRVVADKAKKPGITNLLEIYSVMASVPIAELEKQYKGIGYGKFKSDLAEVIINVLKPLQQKFEKLRQDKDYLAKVLKEGKAKAEPIAQKKLSEVKQKIGMLTD